MKKCFFCDNEAFVEMKILTTGVFVQLCLEHLERYVRNVYEGKIKIGPQSPAKEVAEE